jgi:hypothetical protein
MEAVLYYRHCAAFCDLKTEWAALYREQRQDVLAPGTCLSFRSTSKRLADQQYVGIINVVIGTSLRAAIACEHPLLQPAAFPADATTESEAAAAAVLSSSPMSTSAHPLRPSLASISCGLKNAILLATQRASAVNGEFRGATAVELCVPLLGAGRFRTHWSCDLRQLLRHLIIAAADGLLQLNCDLRVTFVLKEAGTVAIGRSCFEDVLGVTASLQPHRDRLKTMIRFLHGDIFDMPLPEDATTRRILVHPCDSELRCEGSFSQQLASVLAPDQSKQISVLKMSCRVYWQRKAVEIASFVEAVASSSALATTLAPAATDADIQRKRHFDAPPVVVDITGDDNCATSSAERPLKKPRIQPQVEEQTSGADCQKNETTQLLSEE